MADVDFAHLVPGDSVAQSNGERIGRSHGGRLILLRRRRANPGFVVTVDTHPETGVRTEVITTEWATANAAFDRFMKER